MINFKSSKLMKILFLFAGVCAVSLVVFGTTAYANSVGFFAGNDSTETLNACDYVVNQTLDNYESQELEATTSDDDSVELTVNSSSLNSNADISTNVLNAQSNENIRETDVDRSDAGQINLYTDVNYSTMGAAGAIARINQIRYEACSTGVRDPRDESRNLTLADYVPIKWSTDMEWIAQTRAAEACYHMDHERLTGKSCFTCSHNNLTANGEVLAWNFTGMAEGIEQWYSEKGEWDSRGTGVTGHYTIMINPTMNFFGLGTAKVSTNYYYTTAGEFSMSTGLSQDETAEKGQYKQILTFSINSFGVQVHYPLTLEAKSASYIYGVATLRQDTSVQFYVDTYDMDYTSSDESVVEIDDYGNVYGLKAGTSTVSINKTGTLTGPTYTLTVTPSTRPEAQASAAGDGKVLITWGAIDNATKYAISEVGSSGYIEVNYNIPSTTLSYTVSDLSNGVEHYFFVQAYVNGKWSNFDYSNYVSATPTGHMKPYEVSGVSGATSIELTWGRVSGATAYAVSTKNANGSYNIRTTSIAQPSTSKTTVSYTVTGLSNSTTYKFLVQAMVNGHWSTYDESEDLYEASTINTKPTAKAVAGSEDGQIVISWNAIQNATQYACSEYLGNDQFDIHTVDASTLTYTASDLVAQRQHKFLVQAFVAGTWSSYTMDDLVGATPTGSIKPTNIKTTPGATSIKLDWPAVPGATKYAVALYNGNNNYTLLSTDIAKSSAPTYTASGLKDSTSYTFLVQAFVDGAWSRYTTDDHVTDSTVNIKPKASAAATSNDGEIKITWEEVSGATNYACSEYLGNSQFNVHILDSAAARSYTVSDLVAREHQFLVQAFVGGSWSSYTMGDLVKATPSGSVKPTNIKTTAGPSSIKLDWTAVPGATKYAVALYNGSNNYTLLSTDIAKSSAPTYTATGLKDSTTYTFLVKAFVDGSWSKYTTSDHVSASTVNIKPSATAQATSNDGEIIISWGAVSNASQYACSEYLGNGQFNIHYVKSSDLSYTASDLVAGRQHQFLVQACVAGSWSSYAMSDLVGATPTGATYPTISSQSVTDNSVTVSWGKVTGSEQYAASISTDGVNWTINKLDKSTLTYTFNGLKANTTYKVLVQRYADSAWTQNASVSITTDKTKVPVAVYNDSVSSNPTLTFYHDANNHSSEGTVYTVVDKGYESPDWILAHGDDIVTANFDSSFASYRPTNCTSWFMGLGNSKLKTINNIQYLNTSEVKSMQSMFYKCSALTSLDVSNFDTSKCTNFSLMFDGCSQLKQIDVSHFVTNKVTTMDQMFNDCSSLESLNLSSFSDAGIIAFDGYLTMFGGCSSLTSLDLSSFTHAPTNLSQMFYGCTKLVSVDISKLNLSNLAYTFDMFNSCSSLKYIYCNKNIASLSSMKNSTRMFYGCTSLPHFVSSAIDKTYAYPDNGTTGYFTAKA